MAEKLFYTMGEVSEMFDVNPSLLRHWETQFGVLRPKRNKKGNRLYSPKDVETLKSIYHLVKERGMTLEGARRALKQQRPDAVSRDVELAERLQRIRAMLVEVREELKDDGRGIRPEPQEAAAEEAAAEIVPAAGDVAAETSAVSSESAPAPRRRRRAVVKIAPDGTPEPEAEQTGAAAARKPRRKKREEGENKELFAFYEQSLF